MKQQTENIKEQLEEVIKKNLPEKKEITKCRIGDYYEDENWAGFNQALSQINTSLIADEVLKVLKNEMHEELNKYLCENLDLNNLGNEELRNDILQLLSNLSTKENKNNE